MNHFGLRCLTIGSCLYIIGDMLLVGFAEPKNEVKEHFGLSPMENRLAAFMLAGSTKRLFWGMMFGVFGAPFMLLGGLHFWGILKPGVLRTIILGFHIVGGAGATLAHGSFYFLGRVSKEIYKNALDRELYEDEKVFLKEIIHGTVIPWYVVVGSQVMSYLLIAIAIMFHLSDLSRWMVLFTPIVTIPIIYFLDKKWTFPAVFHGALYTIPVLLFAIVLWIPQ